MPRGKELSSEERTKITTYRESGLSIRQIAQKVNRNKSTIVNFLKDPKKYGTNKRSGRPSTLSARGKREVWRLAVKRNLSAGQIKSEMSLPLTKRRILQVLKENPNIQYQQRVKTPKLLPRHKAARLEFAEQHAFWLDEWKSVIFSDEKKFNLDGPDGCQMYWRDIRRNPETRHARNFQGGSIMIWAAFGYRGKTPICIISHKMNSGKYIDLIENVLIDFGDNLWGEHWIFQQDNAAIHSSKQTKSFLASRNIDVMEWPAISPDLNPIENLWGILSARVYANGRQFDTLLQLKTAIQEEWANIDIAVLQSLVDSMPQRLADVITARGGRTKY